MAAFTTSSQTTLTNLPEELLELILLWTCKLSLKNDILNQRCVCKAFDRSLRKYGLRTIQVDVARLMGRRAVAEDGMEGLETTEWVQGLKGLEKSQLSRWGEHVQGIHVNMTGTTEGDINDFTAQISFAHTTYAIAENRILNNLRMTGLGDSTIDAQTFGKGLQDVLSFTPNVRRCKLTLPCAISDKPDHYTIQILATTLEALAKRDEEYALLASVVISHLDNAALNRLCSNHIDLRNAIRTFKHVKNLVLDIGFRAEAGVMQDPFARNLWFLVSLGVELKTLCIINGRVSLHTPYRKGHGRAYMPVMRPRLQHLRCLELRGINLDAADFVQLCTESAKSLKEIYLIDVKLRMADFEGEDRLGDLWLGYPDIDKPDGDTWVAASMAAIEELDLQILRATRLSNEHPFAPDQAPRYDSDELEGGAFEQCFVAVALRQKELHDTIPRAVELASTKAIGTRNTVVNAESYLQDVRNPTSKLQHAIDDVFPDHSMVVPNNLQGLLELIERAEKDVGTEIEHLLAVDDFS